MEHVNDRDIYKEEDLDVCAHEHDSGINTVTIRIELFGTKVTPIDPSRNVWQLQLTNAYFVVIMAGK